MNPQFLEALLNADHVNLYGDPALDLDADLERISALKPRLDGLLSAHFSLVPPDHFQDGTALAGLVIWEAIQPTHEGKAGSCQYAALDFRFSNFGHLFTCLPEYAQLAYDPDALQHAIDLITHEGFRFIPAQSLSEPYSGSHREFRRFTWLERYFADSL
ncbi:MAG: hypothetical protein JWQ44_1723 [Chthoniobacter sp.]|nr:hypothetical protein [Chthoniobacter sp.]